MATMVDDSVDVIYAKRLVGMTWPEVAHDSATGYADNWDRRVHALTDIAPEILISTAPPTVEVTPPPSKWYVPQTESAKTFATTTAREKLAGLSDGHISGRVGHVLDILDAELAFHNGMRLPPVHLFEEDSGAILIEWMFPHFRLGIGIEPDDSESGWLFVSDEHAGGINAYGRLSDEGISSGISLLLERLR